MDDLKPTRDRRAELLFAASIALAGWGLLARLSRVGESAMFGVTHVPIAIGTAASLLAIAAAAWLHRARGRSRAVRAVARSAAIVVIVASAIVWMQFQWRLDLPFVPYDSGIGDGAAPMAGRMSPLTALSGMLAGLTLLLQIATPRFARQLSSASAIVLLLFNAGVALTSLLHVPLFYRASIIPIALLSAIAYVLLAVGLLLGTGGDTWPLALMSPDGYAGGRTHRRSATISYLLLAILGIAIVGVSGYLFLQRELRDARQHAAETVSAVADLKARQIAGWHRERLADARALFAAPVVTDVQSLLTDDSDEAASERFENWMAEIRGVYGYASVMLLNERGEAVLSVPPTERPDASTVNSALEALRQNDVVVEDLRLIASEADPRLTTLIPVGRSEPRAVLVLQASAASALYPIVDVWPTRSASAETLLLRRERDQVVCLNRLRRRGIEPMALRLPIDGSGRLLAVRATIARDGIFEGEDYRGEPVIAALRRIPGTPWVLIAKVDQREVYLAYREQVSRTAAFVAVVLLAFFTAMSMLWHRRGLAWAERENALNERLRRLIDADIIGIIIASPDGRFIEVNDYYLRLIGIERQDLESVTWRSITPPEWNAADENALRELRETGVCTPYEKEYFRPDGTRVPVLLVDVMLPDSQIAAFVLDLTERRRVAAELESVSNQRQVALDAAGMGWWTYDPRTRHAMFDTRTRDMFGVSGELNSLDAIFERIIADDRPRVTEELEAALNPIAPRPYVSEYRVRNGAGEVRWVEASGIAKFEGEGPARVATNFVGTVQDITSRKQAEESLSERMEELRRWHNATLGRENRILQLKREVNELLAAAGRPARYERIEERDERVE